MTEEQHAKPDPSALRDLEAVIEEAKKKVRGSKENDLCKYLPVEKGGYMHHFTMRKMKNILPRELEKMIKTYILDAKTPLRVPPKPRAARGSRKRPDLISLSRDELDRLVGHLRMAGDSELAGKLSQRRSLAACKRQLISSIRANEVRPEYWSAYVEACKAQSNETQEATETNPAAPQLQATATLQAT